MFVKGCRPRCLLSMLYLGQFLSVKMTFTLQTRRLPWAKMRRKCSTLKNNTLLQRILANLFQFEISFVEKISRNIGRTSRLTAFKKAKYDVRCGAVDLNSELHFFVNFIAMFFQIMQHIKHTSKNLTCVFVIIYTYMFRLFFKHMNLNIN